MADKIQKIQITLPNGKQQWVTIPEFNNNRNSAYAKTMVRMIDNEGNEYDVEKTSLNKAQKLGLRPFIFADNAPKQQPTPQPQPTAQQQPTTTAQPPTSPTPPTQTYTPSRFPSFESVTQGFSDYGKAAQQSVDDVMRWNVSGKKESDMQRMTRAYNAYAQDAAKGNEQFIADINKRMQSLPTMLSDRQKQQQEMQISDRYFQNEAERLAYSEAESERIQKELADANAKANALRQQIADKSKADSLNSRLPFKTGAYYGGSLPDAADPELTKQLNEQINRITSLSQQLNKNEAYQRNLQTLENTAKGLTEQANEEYWKREESTPWWARRGGFTSTPLAGSQMNDYRYNQAAAISQNVNSARTLLREASLSNDSFYKQLGRGLRDAAFDINTWDAGLTAVNQAATTLMAKQAYDKGKATAADMAVLESSALKNAIASDTRKAISAWYNAGITTTNMIPFMAYIMASPFNNVGRAFSSSIGKALLNKSTVTLMRKGLSQSAYRASIAGLKGIGRFAGDVVGGSATALTFGNQVMLGDAINRYQGQHTGQFNAEGRFVYTGSNDAKGITQSLLEAFATQAIEYQSELVGEYFTPVWRALGKGMGKGVGKALGYTSKEWFDAAGNKTLSRSLNLMGHKVSLDKTVDLFSRLSNKESVAAFNKFMKATKQNGILGEYLEEVIGNMENATLGINNANWGTGEGGVFNPEENMETFLAVAVGTGFMTGIGGLAGTSHRSMLNRAYNRANKDGMRDFGWDSWVNIREQIDNAAIGELPNIVTNLMKGMNERQAQTIQNYAAFSVAKQGSLIADFKDELEKPHIARVSVDNSDPNDIKVTSFDEQNKPLSVKSFKTEEDAMQYQEMVHEYINNGKNMQVLNELLATDEGYDKAMQIVNQMNDAASQIGLDPSLLLGIDDVAKLFYKDPLKRTDDEQLIVDRFVEAANNVAFPSNEVNTNHERQQGQDLAEGSEIGDQPSIDTVNQRETAAIERWNNTADPDLKSSIATLVANGLNENQIIEYLRQNEYSEDIIEAFAELCNAKAFKDGFIANTGIKISEEVQRKVASNTFSGQLNGEESPIIISVQDQNGAPLFVVGGNISLDEQGILSSDGLVVLRDEQGNFIQRQDMNGLTLLGTQNAEEYQNALLTQTQEAVTAQIQSTEYNDSDIENAPVMPEGNGLTVQQPTQPTQPTQTSKIPLNEKGEKDYSKAPVEDTIADITAQFNGNQESANAVIKSMAEQANADLDAAKKKKDKGPKGKTVEEAIKNQQELENAVADAQSKADYWQGVLDKITPETPPAEEAPIQPPTQDLQPPTDTKPTEYHKLPIEDTIKKLYGTKLNDNEINDLVSHNIKKSFKELEAIKAKSPKIDDKAIDGDIDKYTAAKEQWQQQVNDAQQKLDYWHNVEQYIQQQTHTTDAEIKAAKDELSGANAQAEFAATNEGGAKTPLQVAGEFIKNARILSSDFRKETGLSRKEEQQFPGMISKDGKPIAKLAEELVSYDNDNYNGMFFHGDDMEARNYIIEALQTAGGRSQLGQNTSAEFEAFDRERTQQREDYHQDAYHMSYSDYLAFEEQQMPSVWRRISNFAPEQYDQMVAEYYESLPEDYFTHQNQNNNGTEQNPTVAGSNEILSQPPTNNETGTGQRQDPEAKGGNGSKGDNQDGEVPGGAPGVNAEIKKDIEAFIAESILDVQITSYDEENYEAQISVEDKPSNIVVTPPMEQGEGMHAEYRPENSSYQELGDLLDEYNETVDRKDQGLAAEHLAATFTSVDAAINFENWLNEKNNPNAWENLTEEEKIAAIDADEIADKNAKELAKDFLRGENTGTIAELFYREIVGRAMDKEGSEQKPEKKPASEQKPKTEKPKSEQKTEKPKTQAPKTDTPKQEKKSDTKQAFDEFKDVMKKFRNAGRADANVSLIGLNSRQIEMLADVFRATAKLGYAMVKDGATVFNDWLEKMRAMVSDTIKANSQWNDQDITDLLTETWNNKYLVDGVRKPLSEWAAEEALNTEQEEEKEKAPAQPATVPDNSVVGQSQSPYTKEQAERSFVNSVTDALTQAMETGEKPFRSITDIRKAARKAGMEIEDGKDDIKLQELVEDALVKVARDIITEERFPGQRDIHKFRKETFEKIKLLYNLQPTISMRSSNRVALQQYSTPLPMAFCADMFANGRIMRMFYSAFEPTAGNGMLVFGIPSNRVHVNEIDENRLENLRGQGFKKVTSQDATMPFEGDEYYDAIITNPPFGEAAAKDYDGYQISGLAPQIALNALSKMRDFGKAVIIIGGEQKFASNGVVQNDKPFLTYLYNHYNVKGVIDMDGSLYAKQGTTFPTRMILIDGRRTEEERTKSDVYPPVQKNWIPKADSFDKLYDTVNNIINSNEKTNGTEIVRPGEQPLQPDRGITAPGQNDKRTDSRKPVPNVATTGGGHESDGSTGKGSKRDSNSGVRKRSLFDGSGYISNGEQTGDGRNTGGDNGRGGEGVDNRVSVVDTVSGVSGPAARGVGLTQKQEKRKLESEKLSYRPHNTAFSLESVAPAAMVEAMDKTLKRIEEEYGDIDNFVTSELGYDSVDAMHKALAAEQVDSVAMAIYNMKKGEALIIGDQTGVGKGRQMAALIRWAVRQGKKPVFMTQKSNLFNDIYRDLKDIGSENLKPFIFNNDKDAKISEITEDENGNEKEKIIYRSATEKDIADALKNGKVPEGYDFVLCTYSQVSTGDSISREYEDQINGQETDDSNKKRGRSRRKPKPGAKPKKDTKATLLRTLAKDNYLMLDESHTAAGESNQGYYMQTLVRDSKAVTFASATYAKRPDTMPLYAMRTAMSKANIGMRELIGAIQKGGVTLQEIMSRALSDAGQMVRRERDMNGVVTDWTTIDDPETVKRARDNYDKTIQAFNAIIDFQNTYFEAYLESQRESLAVMAGNAGYVRGTEKMGISNTPFASKTYNYTKQLMLALKVDAIVDEVERQIKEGKKPVIALDNTMGSMLTDLAIGEELEDSTFAASLLRGLESVMQYTQSDGMGGSYKIRIHPNELGAEGEAAYYQLVSFIKESTKNVFISPLDEIINKLKAKGYKVGELTGREKVVVEENGKYYVAKKGKTSKQLLQSRFNNNKLDVLILNKTGSTGISLHASKTFADQRQRVMILAQPLPDINDYMQMIGRIDRTGQVQRGYYINLGLPVPAEQRFLMMLSTKLKSLNANTTTSQDNKDNNVDAPDMLNKYGSQVIVEYFKDHPDIYNKLDDPLKVRNKEGGLSEYKTAPDDSDARKLTGYVALLSSEEQQAFYDDVVERYNTLIKYLDDTGTNDLKITSLPLNAKTLAKAVSSKGTDPEGNNPFAKNAYCEMVEMDVIRKPMKADEVRKAMESVAKGKDPKQAVEDIKTQYETEHQEKIDKQKRKYDSDIERDKETLAKFEGKINSNEKMSEEDKKKAIEDKKLTLQQETDRKNEQATKALNFDHERMMKNLDRYTVGESYLMPDNPDVLTFELVSPAIFLGYKAKDKGITPSSTIAVFATLDGRRRVEIKLSEQNKLNNISEVTNQNYDAAQEVTLDNWDKNAPNQTRKTGYIMTGNILQAIKDTQDENGAFPGQLVSYTDSEGNIHDGILMPDKWQPSMMINAGKPISEMANFILDGNSVISTNGEVEINVERDRYIGNAYVLRVPRSKKTGQKYWDNRELLDAVNGKVFYQSAGKFQVYIPKGKLNDVLAVLDKMGVKVASNITEELNSSADTPTRLAYSNSTNNVNNSRIIPEDVDKSLSLQIENEFEELLEKITGGLSENMKKIFMEYAMNHVVYSSQATIQELDDTYQTEYEKLYGREKNNNGRVSSWLQEQLRLDSTQAGNELSNQKRGEGITRTGEEQSSNLVSTRNGETIQEVYDNNGGKRGASQTYKNRGEGRDLYLLSEIRREIEGILEKNPSAKLSSDQRRSLAARLAISREAAYRGARQQRFADSFGLKEGRATIDDLAKAFKKANKDKALNAIFDKVYDICRRVGTGFYVGNANIDNTGFFQSDGLSNDIFINLASLSRTSMSSIELPVVILHEMIHQGTVGAINLVKSGKAEGILTKEQIYAVNTLIDIYGKALKNKDKFAENDYGLNDVYEFAAQMADPRQRKALSMSPLQRIMAAANELKAQGNNSLRNRIKNALKVLFGLSDLKKMDNAINTLLDTFNETVHGISMNMSGQMGLAYFIGEQGARNMDKAEEANVRLDNLKAARQFESMGKDPKTIKWATGWERGADGKWRYEIPDLTIKPNHSLDRKNAKTYVIGRDISLPIAKLSDVIDAKELFDAYPELKDIKLVTYTPTGGSIAAYYPYLDTIALSSRNTIFEHVYAPVDNWDEINRFIYEHQKLMDKLSDEETEEYYFATDRFGGMSDEELSNDKDWIRFENDFPNVAEAVKFNNKKPEKKGGEVIGARIKDNEFARGVLSHEIQHAIQSIENFAAGGSDNSDYTDNAEYRKLVKQWDKLYKNKKKAYNEWKAALNEYNKTFSEYLHVKARPGRDFMNISDEEKELEKKTDELRKKEEEALEKYQQEQERAKPIEKRMETFELRYYENLGGEVESRNVAARVNMTPEERSRSLASETEDVAREDQIFIYDSFDENEMRSGDLFDKYPTWLSGQTTGTGQHTTQITSTVNTYKKIGDWMKSQGMDGASVLDASSGLGKGTEALRDMGFNVEDVEPYPSENRTAPTYLKYEDIKGKYDVVISNAVLNVIPDDWRADVLKNMADKVKPGGKMIINVRDAKEMERQKQKIELDSPTEILVTDKAGNIRAYQKGFTQKELADWIQSELGEGWTIETAKPSNSGISGRAVVVTRNTDTSLSYRRIENQFSSPSARRVSGENQSQMRAHAQAVAEKLNTKITFTTSDKLEGEKKTAKGWYNKKTGQVVIVLDNNKDNFDIEQTVIHEVVGHKGLRALLGSKGLYRLLDSIYANLDQQAKEAIGEATRRNGWRQYTAIEEYLAEQAEKTVWDAKSASLWQNVKHYLTEALRTLGFMIRPNLKDARYWLWLSKNNIKRSDVMSEIKRNALLNKIERMGAPVLDLLSSDKQDSLAPQEMFRQIVQNDIEHKPLQEAFQDYAISLKDFLKIITEGLGRDLMDNENAYLGENQMGSIASALAQKFVNKQINHLRKTIIGLSDVFSDAKYKISRTADELYKDGQGIINKCEAYLYTKHGLERNRVLYVRDLNKRIERIAINTGTLKRVDVMDIIDKFNDDFQNYKDWLSDELKNHNINFGQYLHSLDDFIRTYAFNHPSANPQPHEIKAINHLNQWYKQHIAGKYDPNKNDMSGLSSFSEYGLGDNFDEQKAIDAVEAIEHSIGDKRLEELWKAVQDVTQFAIDTEYKSGMLSKKAYDRCKTMFEWYVPLRGVSEDTMEDLYAYLGGENDNGSAVQTAKGRQTLANTPLATAYGMALQAINNGVRNQNNQRMYRAVNAWLKNNPNKLAPATIIDCWYEIDNNGNFDMKVPNITDNMTPEQITAETQRFEQEMKIKQQQGIAFKKDIKSYHVRPFSKKSHANDHIVYVKVNGVRKMIVFNGDPRPARVLRGEMNPSITKVNDFLRRLSALNTAWNPTFTLKNLARDTFESYNNIVINENLAYLNKFKTNQLRLMGDGFWAATDIFKKNKSSYLVAFYKWKKGEEPSSYIEKMFFEFMENGGATGFMEYKKMEELQSMLYKNKSVESIAKNPFEIFGIAFGTANEFLENLNRFATYLTSREMGRSVMTSVNNAKEITLNFNRRGAGDKTAIYGNTNKEAIYGWTSWFFRNTRMFFNPSMQSMYRILSNHTRHPFKSALLDVGVFMLLSSMMPMINAFLISLAGDDGDDDRYSDLSAWTRRNNICIYNPFQKTWITIPLPPNIAAFYGMGDVAYGYIFDKSFQSGYGVWSDIASQLAMIMPMDYIGKNGTIKPLDSIIMETVVGDVANPVLEIAMNKNWLGYEIYKENEWNGNDPEWQRCYSNTNQLFVELSKSINSIGNDYEYLKGPWDNRLFNPGILQHLVESYTGGFGKDLANAVSLIKEPDLNKIPVYRGFVRTPDNTNRYQRVRVKYNVYKDEADKLYDNLRKLQKNGDLGDTVAKIKYIGTEEKRNPEFRRMVEVKKKEKYIKFCQDMMKNAKDDITKDAWELELNKTKRDVVDICDQIE